MSQIAKQWRSLDELAADAATIERFSDEFPDLAEALGSPHTRRRVIRMIIASTAAAGISGCDDDEMLLIPAVRAPENIVPGLPNFFSGAHVRNGYATGTVVAHHMGRPIRVDGNPLHPASLGAVDIFAQAELMEFYDPQRDWAIRKHGKPASEDELKQALALERDEIASTRGRSLRILTGFSTSPTFVGQIDALLKAYPEARWIQWEPFSRVNIAKGAQLAYGQAVEAIPKLDAADVILALDSDLLNGAPGSLSFARRFAARRNPTRTGQMNRLYAIETIPTLTGAMADHRFVAGPQELNRFVMTLAAALLANEPIVAPQWLDAVVADLRRNKGRALIHVGPEHPPETHALVHAMNEALDARNNTFDLIAPVLRDAADAGAFPDLAEEMRRGDVRTLLIIDANPVFAAPGAVGFAEAMARVPFTFALSRSPNKTTDAALFAAPLLHPWESWSDARAFDGTATIVQPQALPLYGGYDACQALALLTQAQPPTTVEMVKTEWASLRKNDSTDAWHAALANGIVEGSAAKSSNVTLRAEARSLSPPDVLSGTLTLLFRPDPYVWDGRYAANPWLRELPHPLTRIAWDNPLLIAPKTARRLKLENGDIARVTIGAAQATAPIWIAPGQAQNCIVAPLGLGENQEIGGYDYYPLMGRNAEPRVEKTGKRVDIASVERHQSMFDAGGDFVRTGALDEFLKNKHFLAERAAPGAEQNLYYREPEGPAAWAMSIDLGACIGCNACVVACQAENNIPVVGKEQVLRQRELHWLRIDRYYEGDADQPSAYFQPVLCMHCEAAPCETVCPVGATVHDSEGLNVMVYNRCIGTRFCSNNCPYKVRRFNYFAYAREERRSPLARNPEVTVRARGVMEKCTFCLQRIAAERIAADRENRPVGEVTTACQAACPTQAFTFGNLNESGSAVAARKRSPLDYTLLASQNTRPRVSYEARIFNRNQEIGKTR
ncbi:TAT-variant-translocated molybdopterin oxidoreductase [Methylocystis sp. JAN1]|uniref:TAT-variant-translocated molybdopterin oxidoreductase n=1 Tax=Methylocystis sp. JAN1 TaxID=3397211 RepID=UPI003FA2BB55